MKKTFLHLLLPALILSAGLAWDLWAQSTQQYTAPVPYDSGQLELAPDGAGNLYPVLHRGNFGGTTNGVAKLDGSGNVVDTSWTYPTGSAAAPGAGSCISAKQTWVQTSGGNAGLLFTCPNGASSTPVAQTAFGDNFNQVTGGTGTITASGASTFQIAPGDGILSTPATTGPNKVTVNFGFASEAQGDIAYYTGSAWARLAAGTSGNFLKTQGAGANPVWAAAGGGTQTITRPMTLSTVFTQNANAFVDTIHGTNLDYSAVRFVNAVTADAYYQFKIPANLAATPAWALVLSSKAASGAGGNAFIQLKCEVVADNAAFDAALTTVFTAAVVAIRTSANLTVNTLVKTGSDNDSTLALVAGSVLSCNVERQGGNGSDTIAADWLLLDLSVRLNENS